MSQILFLSGSTRKDSLNKKLAKYACTLAKSKGANAVFIDLADYEMPIYNSDYEKENGLPNNVSILKEKFYSSNGFFIASPEYNSSFSALLKNTIDWISRPSKENEEPLKAFKGKAAAIAAASPGNLGGLRGLVPLRMLLGNLGTIVIPDQIAIPKAHTEFNANGNIKSDYFNKSLDNIISSLISYSKI